MNFGHIHKVWENNYLQIMVMNKEQHFAQEEYSRVRKPDAK